MRSGEHMILSYYVSVHSALLYVGLINDPAYSLDVKAHAPRLNPCLLPFPDQHLLAATFATLCGCAVCQPAATGVNRRMPVPIVFDDTRTVDVSCSLVHHRRVAAVPPPLQLLSCQIGLGHAAKANTNAVMQMLFFVPDWDEEQHRSGVGSSLTRSKNWLQFLIDYVADLTRKRLKLVLSLVLAGLQVAVPLLLVSQFLVLLLLPSQLLLLRLLGNRQVQDGGQVQWRRKHLWKFAPDVCHSQRNHVGSEIPEVVGLFDLVHILFIDAREPVEDLDLVEGRRQDRLPLLDGAVVAQV
ncbi:hypothetical protein FN846DRAFT_915876, partial [Sphaerosporella brunnea]